MKNLFLIIILLLLIFISNSCVNKGVQSESLSSTLSDTQIANYLNYSLVKIEDQFKKPLYKVDCILDTVQISFTLKHENNVSLDNLFFIILASSGYDIKDAVIYKGFYKPVMKSKSFKICCSKRGGMQYFFWAVDKKSKKQYKWSAKATSLKYKNHYHIELLYEKDKYGDRFYTEDFFDSHSPPFTDGTICKCLIQ